MSGGGIAKIGEMALIGMAAPEVATMFASDAAPAAIASDAATSTIASDVATSTIPTATGAVNLGSVTGSDLSAAYDPAGTLPGSSVASASPLQSRGIGSLLDQTKQGVLNQITQGALDQTTQAAGMDKSALGNNLTPEFWNSQYGSLNAPTSVGGTAAATDPMYSGAAGTEAASSSSAIPTQSEQYSLSQMPTGSSNQQSGVGGLLKWAQANPAQAAAMGLGANYLFNKMATPNYLPGYTPPSAASYGLGRTLAAGYQPVRPMAGGGLTVGAGSVPTQGVAPSDLMQKPNQGAGLDSLAAQYGISPQMVSQARQTYGFSAGGPTEMAVGGKLLSGHGDGMSDSIKANISGSQEARLGDGEFVVPADVVSHLGNGSTDAGAKQLYSMMDKVRKARTGRKAQGRQINPQQYMPA